MNMNKTYKHIYLVAIFTLLLGIFLIIFSYINQLKLQNLYKYHITKNSDYKVVLKDNLFFKEKILDSDKLYIPTLIDNYEITFKYQFKGNLNEKIYYQYNVTADLIATIDNTEEAEIWSKKFIIVPNNIGYNKKQFTINSNFNIDYQYYNNLVNAFQKQYNINVNAILKVKLNVKYNLESNNYKNNNDCLEINIKLGNEFSKIDNLYQTNTIKKINNKKNLSLFYILGSLFIIISLIIIFSIYKKNTTDYERKLKHILKTYYDIIVTIKKQPNINNLIKIEIELINDLIDIAEQNNSHIMYYEINKGKESIFYVILDKYVYIYKLKD